MKNSNEHLVPEWEKSFDEKYKCNCFLCQEKGHEFSTTAEDMKSFIRSLLASHHAHLKERVMQHIDLIIKREDIRIRAESVVRDQRPFDTIVKDEAILIKKLLE